MKIYERLPFIYDVATSDQNWQTALDHCAQAANSKGVILCAANKAGADFEVNATSTVWTLLPKLLSHYTANFMHYDEPACMKLNERDPFQMTFDKEIWPELNVTNVRDDVKFLTENVGVDQRSGISISQDSSWMAVLIFQFALENETPLVLERKDTQILSQHLGKAFEMNRFCNHLRQKYQAVLGVLDHMNVGLCVAMESGELLTYNAKARQIFNDQNGLKLDRYGHIEATDHQKTIQLKNTINACCKTASGKNMAVEYSFQIKKRTDMEPYFVEISPLRDGASAIADGFFGAMVLIIDPNKPPLISLEPLKTLLKLTGAELNVAGLLLKGNTLMDVSEIRGVAIDTVKTQAKAVYAKTGVLSLFIKQLCRTITHLKSNRWSGHSERSVWPALREWKICLPDICCVKAVGG